MFRFSDNSIVCIMIVFCEYIHGELFVPLRVDGASLGVGLQVAALLSVHCHLTEGVTR